LKFENSGSFDYHCARHSSMKGTITVKEKQDSSKQDSSSTSVFPSLIFIYLVLLSGIAVFIF